MQLPVVDPKSAVEFARNWKYKGQLFVNLDPAHIAFATDLATAVLQNFIREQMQQMAEARKPKVILVEE